MRQLTKKQAIELAKTKFWELLSFEKRALFQLNQKKLCMPFDIFHEAMEKSLGRPVWTHEFCDWKKLKDEFLGKKKRPSMKEIINLIPKEKRILL